MIKASGALTLERLPGHEASYPEIKDPSILVLPDQKYMMYASIGTSKAQQWKVGRFLSEKLEGPWREIPPVTIVDIEGPQVCAPAVLYQLQDKKEKWTMYIQTACFIENSVIAELTSEDGETFTPIAASLITKEHIEKPREVIVGVYDPGISEVFLENERGLAMVFSGYRNVGSGDLYLAYKRENEFQWSPAKLVLAQEDVPVHNRPGSENYEWGLEGGKLVQVSGDLFLMIAVCFLPLPKGHEGQRQRVFFAASRSLYGPYVFLGTPFQPQEYETGKGEHGHPDTVLVDHDLWIIYQERKGEGHPWHLRYVIIDFEQFVDHAAKTLLMYPLSMLNL